jgi:hypothetical protein
LDKWSLKSNRLLSEIHEPGLIPAIKLKSLQCAEQRRGASQKGAVIQSYSPHRETYHGGLVTELRWTEPTLLVAVNLLIFFSKTGLFQSSV